MEAEERNPALVCKFRNTTNVYLVLVCLVLRGEDALDSINSNLWFSVCSTTTRFIIFIKGIIRVILSNKGKEFIYVIELYIYAF